MPCSVNIAGRTALFLKEDEGGMYLGERRRSILGGEEAGETGWDVMYIRNKN